MNECQFCGKIPRGDFYFGFNGKRVEIETAMPYVCPLCHAKRIENYIEQRKAFVNKILKVENGSASVKWENFFDACESHTTEDDAGWDVVDFLRAIGILTTESNGYWLNLGNGEIKPISSKRRHYSFKQKGDAFLYAEYYYEYTKKIRYGICRVSEYVHPCELRI